MKESILLEIRNMLEKEKKEINERNEVIMKIKELEKTQEVKEYVKLLGLKQESPKLIKKSEKQIIESIYYGYLSKIKENDTNKIYVYMGTYEYSSEIDIVHGSTDHRVKYDYSGADYRVYRDIEQYFSVVIPISKCKDFEENNIIINPGKDTYYQIQKDFFIACVKTSQESAKRKIIRKYSRI